MKRYIVDGNVIDTRNVVGFAGERLFVEFDDHAALLRAVAEEVKGMEHDLRCARTVWYWESVPDKDPIHRYRIDESKCNCPKSRALALLEVKP